MLAALLLLASTHGALHFVDDDYSAAMARARREHKPVFIDFWATWCHSCLSMQRYVLSDKALTPVSRDAVFLAVETEQEKNRSVVEKFPLDGWPTFLVVDPRDETVIARWLGSASVTEMRRFIEDATQAYRAKGKLDPAAKAQQEGDRARVKNDLKAAAEAYGRAVALSKAQDPQRPERLNLYATALMRQRTPEAARACVELGLREMRATGSSVVANDFASTVASCGDELPKDDPSRAKIRTAAMERMREVLADPKAPLAADDRSDALATIAGMQDEEGHHDQALDTMRERAAVLEKAAAAAPDPEMASTFDAHRVDTYLFLGEAQKAEQLLAGREKEMPSDYNPPARLARVLLEEKKLPDAEAAVDRALSKMTRGQRRVGILGLKAKILRAEGKPAESVLKEQLALMRSLPATQRNPDAEKRISDELDQKTAAK